MVERIAMRRLGTVQDIANMVTFLVSDHTTWVTGQIISVGGGK